MNGRIRGMVKGKRRREEGRGSNSAGLCALLGSRVRRARRIHGSHHNRQTHKEDQVTYSDGRVDDSEGWSRRVPNTP